MHRIPKEEIERIKAETDLVGLVRSSGVELKPSGKDLIGLCPFHDDTEPSLAVSPKKNLWHCLGACSEGGSAVDWVMKTRNLDFGRALLFLKSGETVADEDKGKDDPGKDDPGKDDLPKIALDSVVEYYSRKLADNKHAVDYLKQRGLTSPELYQRFKIGFADGSLSDMLNSEQKKSLIEIGIYRANKCEHFNGCLTFPLVDEHGRTVGCYGRNINPRMNVKHLYTKGEHSGLFNPKAAKVYGRIVLAESIIDALSLMELGVENVVPLYGINGLTDAHIKSLKRDRVESVVLALDDDKGGHKAAESMRKVLEAEGFVVETVFPEQGDWNDFLVRAVESGEPLDAVRKRLPEAFGRRESDASKPERKAAYFDSITEDPSGRLFKVRDMVYKVAGAKELFVSSLKVGIKTARINSDGEETDVYFDSPDLYSAYGRTKFGRAVAPLYGLELRQVEKDLIRILEYFENQRDLRLSSIDKKKGRPELGPEEIKLGMDFLKSTDLFARISDDLEQMGYTGEDLNKRLLYLAASSRLMDDPISVVVQSQSASGKSRMVDTVAELMPPEDVISVTSLSDQALNYADDLQHKFLSLGEAVHSEVVEHQIREMLSAKRLSRLVTLKDPKSGKMSSRPVITPAVVSAAITATGYRINPENASRSFLINIDESREQTQNIHRSQREKYSPDRYYQKRNAVPDIVRKHRAAQRLLKKRIIFNRFADLIKFPDGLVRTRRDNERFIDLISTACFLRQYQKKLKNDGKTEYIECDLEDYAVAYEIMIQGVLGSSLEEIPQGARRLYDDLTKLTEKKADEKKLGICEISFTQREIREFTGANQSWIKRHIRCLIDYEYIVRAGGGQSRTKGYYRLAGSEPIERLDLSMIPDPKKMMALIRKSSSTTGSPSKAAQIKG